MSNVSTTVSKTKKRPVRFSWFGTDGTTPQSGGTVPMGSENSSIAQVTIDPNNPRRALIQGMNQGSTNVIIGSGASPLTVNVTVTAAPDLTHFELDGFDPEE